MNKAGVQHFIIIIFSIPFGSLQEMEQDVLNIFQWQRMTVQNKSTIGTFEKKGRKKMVSLKRKEKSRQEI